MTDRFYPLGLPSAENAWKTTYEVQNEMRSFQRSAYPPGYAGHEPGAKDKFGFSNPGPDASRLSKGELALVEDVDIPGPRRIHAMTRVQVPDDRVTFSHFDLPQRSGQSPLSLTSQSMMPRPRSLPNLPKQPAPARLSEVPKPIVRLEDDRHSYFVPQDLQREPSHRILGASLTKLDKREKVRLTMGGFGTGFRTQCPQADWWPTNMHDGNMDHWNSSHERGTYQRHKFYRMSPVGAV
eukprot:gnl/TRDRNA2_/TRDRNA2_40158_c0_seq1.p1 gnl/TRDRNA2_/TRDRNA2_40158_c0~~gnl/TRDRNA2_/TRDRNA2_40158_c0_seq1.p1  ORF type:complete len:238 (+),score=35.32 gnl/TRDRNA2_/TRDRNA2_40158_c0_seq1:69-782(+)